MAGRGPCSPDFASELNAIIFNCLSGFADEAIHFDEDVRILKQRLLDEKLLILVEPAFQSMLGHMRSETFGKFKESLGMALDRGEGFSAAAHGCAQHYLASFDKCLFSCVAIERAKWDTSGVRENLHRDMDGQVVSLQSDKLSHLTKTYEMKLYDSLAGQVDNLFKNADDETRSSTRELLQHEAAYPVAGFSDALSRFEIGERVKRDMIGNSNERTWSKARMTTSRLYPRMRCLLCFCEGAVSSVRGVLG
ncbi:hypothetical protein MLD38_030240 [Melastoma candidum]|uniref:Uncharacterized protein n=1 Tax=Melastoma candidum TaxID=119954 RepID=A0ACB9MMY3_9MYRT|nr:hypothetical protein MLD38_030240 [Melastoma candidum]